MNLLFILFALLIDPNKIGKVNDAKTEAKNAYERGEYDKAVVHYRILDSLGVKEDEVSMNLAHSYFHLNDSVNAQNAYLSLTSSRNPTLKSVANQQLGVMSNRQGKYEAALQYFKDALKADPTNDDARYNYEMVKKKLEEKKKQEEQQQQKNDQNKEDQKNEDKDKKNQDNKDQKGNKDDKEKKDQKQDKEKQDQDQQQKEKDQKQKEQQQKEQQQKEQQEKDQEKRDTPPEVSDKLKEMKISEEKARMVLEAMKNQEVQYLQQNKRKATKPKNKNKPDW